jgi:hypothetical protein
MGVLGRNILRRRRNIGRIQLPQTLAVTNNCEWQPENGNSIPPIEKRKNRAPY